MALPRVLCRARLLLNNDFTVVSKYHIVNSASLRKSVQIRTVRYFRTHFSAGAVLSNNKNEIDRDLPSSSSSSSSDSESTDSDSDSEDDVTVEYHKGLPQITVPLPSRKERCCFTLKPISNTVGDFLEMLRKEDRGIDRVLCKTRDGTRIASSNTIETLLDDDFKLVINDCSYNVSTPKQERVTGEEIQRLDDVKNLINQLYEAMHIEEHQITKEKELLAQLETLQQELMPLEQKKMELEMIALRRGNWMAWAGLGLMSVQFGILARLTWWEYSWDIMEPVTYFVTYGTAMACYAYYVVTKTEYVLQDVRDRQHLLIIHKKAQKLGVDLNQYNMLKQEVVRHQQYLKKLRNPLKLKVPPRPLARTAPIVEVVPETPTTAPPVTEVPRSAAGIPKVTALLTGLLNKAPVLKNVPVLKNSTLPEPEVAKKVEGSSANSEQSVKDKEVPKK